MQHIREIYAETLAKLEMVRSRLITEIRELEYVLDNNLVASNGDPLDPESYAEATNNLHLDVKEVHEDIELVNGQIIYLENWLDSQPV